MATDAIATRRARARPARDTPAAGAAEPADAGAIETLAEGCAQAIERDILSGALVPDAKLSIADLGLRYGVSATPLREGLSRLVSRGLIVAIGQRGFRVTDVSRADLADITATRLLIECAALRLAMERGDDRWEAEIVATLHRLRRFTERKGGGAEGRPEFDDVHKAFHAALIAACGSARLLELQRQLYDQAYRYRRVLMTRLPADARFLAAHERLAERVLARDHAVAADLLADHLSATLAIVYPGFGTKAGAGGQRAPTRRGKP